MKKLLLATLVAASFSAHAQYMGTVPPNAELGFNYTTDSDKFNTRYGWVGASASNGWGVRYGVGHGSGNDATVGTVLFYNRVPPEKQNITSTSGFNTQVLQATYVNIGENHDFQGAFGVKRVNSTATLDGVVYNDTQDVLVGTAELKLVMTDTLTIGGTVTRDVVETSGNTVYAAIPGSYSNTTATTVALDMDLQLSDNLSIFAQVGETFFSNANERTFVHTKTTYAVLPEYGVSVFGRVKYQYDTNPTDLTGDKCYNNDIAGTVNDGWVCPTAVPYFSPEQRFTVAPGVQYRKPFAGMVFTGSVEYGKQWTTVQSDTTSTNIHSWSLGLQTSPGKKTGVTFGATVFGTNANITGNSGDYNWYGLYSWIKVPLK